MKQALKRYWVKVIIFGITINAALLFTEAHLPNISAVVAIIGIVVAIYLMMSGLDGLIRGWDR